MGHAAKIELTTHDHMHMSNFSTEDGSTQIYVLLLAAYRWIDFSGFWLLYQHLYIY